MIKFHKVRASDSPKTAYTFGSDALELKEEFARLVHRPVDLVMRDALKPFIKVHILAEAFPL